MWLEEKQLNIETAGREGAPDVLFIHGAGGCSEVWRDAMELLADDFSVAALDLSGHGDSAAKDGGHTLATYISDVLAALDALGGKPVICGHSMGGAVAIQTALDAPDSVSALILANTGARLRVFPALFEQLRTDFSGAIKNFPQLAFSPDADAEVYLRYAQIMLRADPMTTLQDFRICDLFDAMPRLGEICARTLVIGAGKDHLTPNKYSKFLGEGIAGAELAEMPRCGHMAMMEDPAGFAQICRPFLSRMKQ